MRATPPRCNIYFLLFQTLNSMDYKGSMTSLQSCQSAFSTLSKASKHSTSGISSNNHSENHLVWIWHIFNFLFFILNISVIVWGGMRQIFLTTEFNLKLGKFFNILVWTLVHYPVVSILLFVRIFNLGKLFSRKNYAKKFEFWTPFGRSNLAHFRFHSFRFQIWIKYTLKIWMIIRVYIKQAYIDSD